MARTPHASAQAPQAVHASSRNRSRIDEPSTSLSIAFSGQTASHTGQPKQSFEISIDAKGSHGSLRVGPSAAARRTDSRRVSRVAALFEARRRNNPLREIASPFSPRTMSCGFAMRNRPRRCGRASRSESNRVRHVCRPGASGQPVQSGMARVMVARDASPARLRGSRAARQVAIPAPASGFRSHEKTADAPGSDRMRSPRRASRPRGSERPSRGQLAVQMPQPTQFAAIASLPPLAGEMAPTGQASTQRRHDARVVFARAQRPVNRGRGSPAEAIASRAETNGRIAYLLRLRRPDACARAGCGRR